MQGEEKAKGKLTVVDLTWLNWLADGSTSLVPF